MNCPACGCTKLFGPATIVDDLGTDHEYYDCCRCHTLILVDDGKLIAKAGAW